MADNKKSKAAEAATTDGDNSIDIETPIVLVEKTNSTHLNTLAVVSIATSATGFGALAGVITGHVALSQIRHTAQKGKGLAIAGLVAGYAGLAAFALMGALSVAGHWAEDRHDDHRGPGHMMNNEQGPRDGQFDGMMGGHFGRGGQDDMGFGPMGGQNGPTIKLPNGQIITIPNGESNGDPSMMGDPGWMDGSWLPGDQPPQPTPIPSGAQGN